MTGKIPSFGKCKFIFRSLKLITAACVQDVLDPLRSLVTECLTKIKIYAHKGFFRFFRMSSPTNETLTRKAYLIATSVFTNKYYCEYYFRNTLILDDRYCPSP